MLHEQRKRLTTQDFIKKSKSVHGDKYDYSQVVFSGLSNNSPKVTIVCPKHGPFNQHPANHIYYKQGCPKCNESDGEKLISRILERHNIEFIPQKRFSDCVSVGANSRCFTLPFDFYIPNKKILIEYDGIQHSEPVDLFGGQESFERTRLLDQIKNMYAITNKIKLIRISSKIPHSEVEQLLISQIQ